MSWRDRYLTGSFRGVEFFVKRDSNDGGRKVVTHEYPGRDTPNTEDQGRATRTYNISAILLGDDYLEQRDALLTACENTSGSGQLIHPYFGALDVNCIRVTTTDDDTETNMVRVNMTFVESGQEVAPQPVINRKFEIADNKLEALDQTKNVLEAIYDISRIPANKVAEVRNVITDAFDEIEKVRLTVRSVDSYRRILDRARADVDALLNNVEDLADTFVNLLSFGTFPDGLYPIDRSDEFDEGNEDFAADEENSLTQFNEFRTLWEFAPTSTTTTSDAVRDAFIQASVTMGAALVSTIEFTSLNDAEEIRDVVITEINSILLDELDPNLAGALRDLKTSVIGDINERGADLARLTTITLPQAIPTLVLSHDLYGTLDEEQDIIDRNKIEHPGFTPAGEPIEILIDV